MKNLFSENLAFNVHLENEKNYFVQSRNGAFHLLFSKTPTSRCLLTTPAGNSGVMLLFEGKKPLKLNAPLEISGKEEAIFSLKMDSPRIIYLTVLGSVRVIREYIEGGSIECMHNYMLDTMTKLDKNDEFYSKLKKWTSPKLEIKDSGKRAFIKLKALDGIHHYELELTAESGIFEIIEERNPTIGVNTKFLVPKGNIFIRYKSTFAPLTPFPVNELFNEKALDTIKNAPKHLKENIIMNLNSLRFMAYKEKFIAGSWRFLTYFGRDTLLSLRLLAPIIKPEAIEAEFRGIAEFLNDKGEVAHEEELGDMSGIYQIYKWNDSGCKKPLSIKDIKEADYCAIDSTYLTIPLLLDYYYIGGRNLFSSNHPLFNSILKNINFIIEEATNFQPVELHKGITVGDWRDSCSGLAFGRYAFSVNGAMIPAAISSLKKLLSLSAWNKEELLYVAEENNFNALKDVIKNTEKIKELNKYWSEMWKNFRINVQKSEKLENLKRMKDNLGYFNTEIENVFKNGFLALSLDENKNPIPILQSDVLFMLLDFPINEEWLDLACETFEAKVPYGLMSDAGMLVASQSMAPEKYSEMFNRNHYHGQVIWAWCQLLLKVALEKQLNKWITPSPSEKILNEEKKTRLKKILKEITGIIEAHPQFSTSELWTWDFNGEKEIPIPYGQVTGNETESNAIQLWSAAALGLQLWDLMQK